MTPFHAEPIKHPDAGPQEEIRVGWASWDEHHDRTSVKYAWKDSLGRTSRGGEVPTYAIPQMMAAAIRAGRLAADDVDPDDAALIRRFLASERKGLKALLAAAPLEGVDLARSRDKGRKVEL